MNLIYSLFGDNLNKPVVVRHQDRRALLGISDELAFRKIVFGFFENGVVDFRTAKVDPGALAQLEYFAGSISALILKEKLNQFLSDDSAHQSLDPVILEMIRKFVIALGNGEEQAQFLDLARSRDFRYVWFALTGSTSLLSLGEKFKVEECEIDELVSITINKIESLRPGEIASFLTGTLIHETQMNVKNTLSGEWELHHCNSAFQQPLRIYLPSQQEILNRDFWKRIFLEKFGGFSSPISFPQLDNSRISAAQIAPQKCNTCHISSHMGILKNFIVNLSNLPIEQALLEWKQFKVQFGSFLLQQKEMKKNDPLGVICQIGHAKHEQQFATAALFNQCIQGGQYEATMKAFRETFVQFGFSSCHLPKNDLQNLLAMNRELIKGLNGLFLTLDQVQPIFDQIDNRYVKHSIDLFVSQYKEKQLRAEGILLEDIKRCSFIPDIFYEWGKTFSCQLQGLDPSKKQPIYGTLPGKPAVSTLEQLEQFLAALESHPQWLSGLENKESFVNLLIQGVQAGCLTQVDSIISKLSSHDQEFFLRHALDNKNISGNFFPKTVEEFFFKHLDSFCAERLNIKNPLGLFQQLIVQAIRDLDFPLLYKLYKIYPSRFDKTFEDRIADRLNLMSGSEIAELKLAVSQLKYSNIKSKMENAFVHYHYQMGHFEELLAYSDHKDVTPISRFSQFQHTHQTYAGALMLLQEASRHPMSSQIYFDLVNYTLREKNRDLLMQILELGQKGNFIVSEFILMNSNFEISHLRLFYECAVNFQFNQQADDCLKAIEVFEMMIKSYHSMI